MKSAVAWIAVALLGTALHGETLTVVGWNLDLERRSLGSIAHRFESLGAVDLWALSGVEERSLDRLAKLTAAGNGADEYAFVRSTSGRSDLAIFYDSRKFVLASHCELDEILPSAGGSRVPLVGHFRVQASGSELLLADVHFYATSSQIEDADRYRQMQLFNRWAAKAGLPVLAAGDFNLAWYLEGEEEEGASREFRELTADDSLRWLRPENLVRTHCADRYPGVRHFVFAGGSAREWAARAEIPFPEDAYCESVRGEGHRPVRAVVELP